MTPSAAPTTPSSRKRKDSTGKQKFDDLPMSERLV
jgi:hypothetical protein